MMGIYALEYRTKSTLSIWTFRCADILSARIKGKIVSNERGWSFNRAYLIYEIPTY